MNVNPNTPIIEWPMKLPEEAPEKTPEKKPEEKPKPIDHENRCWETYD